MARPAERAHLSLDAPCCQHAVRQRTPMSFADRQAARTHLQVVAPAKSHEHTDWAGSAVAGQRARCRLCPRPCCLCRVSPSHALTDGIMFADHGRAWSPDVLGTDLRHRHPRQRCLGRHQGHRGGQRRRCAPPACDLSTGCWSAVPQARWLGSRAEPRMRASWLRDRAHPGPPAPLVLGRAPWRFGADEKACCSLRDEIRHRAFGGGGRFVDNMKNFALFKTLNVLSSHALNLLFSKMLKNMWMRFTNV